MTSKTEVTSGWEKVSPDVAMTMLQTMRANRKVVQAHVATLTEAMRRKEWIEEAGDPIRFNGNGELIDGQNRLWAIVESGATLRFNVIRGLPNEAMSILDTGRRRSLKDFLHLSGEQNPTELAGALNYLHAFRASGELVDQVWGLPKLTFKQALELLGKNPGLREAARRVYSLVKFIGGGRSRWTAISYLLTCIDAPDAEAFLQTLHTGEEVQRGSPIGFLRTRLITETRSFKKLQAREYTALVFKAWNSYRKGGRMQHLSWRGGGAHPEEYPVPV